MKKQTKSDWKKHLIFTTIATAFLLAANFMVVAQTKKYKSGDRVECDWLQNGNFDKGTVVPFDKNDLDQSGRWYRVKLDKDTIPNSTVECMANRLRLPVEEKDDSQNNTGDEQNQNQPGKNNDAGDKSSSKNKAAKFKPGDRVECDKAQIGVWEKGTIVHFLQDDMDKESGRYYRVKLDGYKLYPAGHQCMTNFIRPINGAPLKAGKKYKAGDSVEAKNLNNTWLPAKIISVDGAFYKVRYDSRDSRYDETVDETRLRLPGTQEDENQNTQNETTKTPKTGGAPRSLPGTAWKIDFGKGVSGTVFLFCRNGRWHNVLPNSIGAVGKSYSVSGSTLTTVNQDDGMVQKWKMSWQGDVLVLNDGKVTLKLHYNGETQCK